MNRTSVQSREIAVVGYDPSKSTLEVTFRRGGVYHYYDIPAQVHTDFLKADSLGTFFSREIKERYPYKKIC